MVGSDRGTTRSSTRFERGPVQIETGTLVLRGQTLQCQSALVAASSDHRSGGIAESSHVPRGDLTLSESLAVVLPRGDETEGVMNGSETSASLGTC